MAISGMCAECSKRALCKHLCPEANAYANQDQVKRRERVIGLPTGDFTWPDFAGKQFKMTKNQAELVSLMLQGKSRLQICRTMGISFREYHHLLVRIHEKYHKPT